MLVAFDFDGTCFTGIGWNPHVLKLLMRHATAGHDVAIITTRNPLHEEESWFLIHQPERVTVRELLEAENIDIPCYYTSHAPKVDTMREIGCYRLFDDDSAEIERVRQRGLQAIAMTYEGCELMATEEHEPCIVCGHDTWLVGQYCVPPMCFCGACTTGVAR